MKKRAWVRAMMLALAVAGYGCGGDSTAGDAGTDAESPEMDATTAGCGDGVRRADEVCDDGNTEDGDGCSASCQSDESCGNSVVDMPVGELCDDGNTEDGDGCRSDCMSDYRCGNGVVDSMSEGADADEVCDDGNTVNGDGCSAACDSDESCGNSIVDLGAGEVCDDGNTEDGDECSADCMTSLLCGNGELDGAEECDDGNTDDADGCNASCQIERCGNGRTDAGEDCDDGDDDDANGCTAACTFTCSADTDCDDGESCNGDETCTNPGTATSQCVAGTDLADDTDCGGGRVCRSGACVLAGCGDGTVAGSEECDDGNTTDGDGCDVDCTWTCESAADCDDGNLCNGDETCSAAGTLGSSCIAGTTATDGTECDRDMMTGTRDVCVASACTASVCGDGFTDTGATPAEQCDDGNTMPGDGCNSTCQTETAPAPTGFRITNLDLISPRVTIELGACSDITETGLISVNGELDNAISSRSLNLVNVFSPLDIAAATSPFEIHLNAACSAGSPDTCTANSTPNMASATASNQSAGMCLVPVAADVHARAGSPAMYLPTANTIGGPCFVTDEQALTVTFAIMGENISIPLQRARIAATYDDVPTDDLVPGVIVGFLSASDAADVIIPSGVVLIGGDSLYEHLQAGDNTTTNSAGVTIQDGCNVGGGTHEDDRDTLTTGSGDVPGFWFFLNFQAELVDWTP